MKGEDLLLLEYKHKSELFDCYAKYIDKLLKFTQYPSAEI